MLHWSVGCGVDRICEGFVRFVRHGGCDFGGEVLAKLCASARAIKSLSAARVRNTNKSSQ